MIESVLKGDKYNTKLEVVTEERDIVGLKRTAARERATAFKSAKDVEPGPSGRKGKASKKTGGTAPGIGESIYIYIVIKIDR